MRIWLHFRTHFTRAVKVQKIHLSFGEIWQEITECYLKIVNDVLQTLF
jgi:hypothetical protein